MSEPISTRKSTLSLLDLPGEIRNQIWESALSQRTLIPVLAPVYFPSGNYDSSFPASYPTLMKFREPAFSLVNKTLRQEVLSIFYGSNEFRLGRIDFREHGNGHTPEQYIRALRRWKEGLERDAAGRFLRRLTVGLVVRVEKVADGKDYVYDQGVLFEGYGTAVRLHDGWEEFCVCGLQERGTGDGRALVDAAVAICEGLGERVREERCDGCEKRRLVKV